MPAAQGGELELDPKALEAAAEALYQFNPSTDQESDLDGRSVGGEYMIHWDSDGLSDEQRQMVREEAEATISAYLAALTDRRPAPMTPQGASERCPSCDGTGDLTRLDGEWMGYCTCPAGEALKHPQQERAEEWECFCDESYYDMWAVRPKGDRSFQSQQLFHLPSKEEAEALRDILSRRADGRGQP